MSGPSLADRRAALEERYTPWSPRSLGAMLDAMAAEWGERPLVITDEREYTYAEVSDHSRRLAAGLIGLGVQPGDRVGLVMANHPEFAACKFAIARTGAIAVPFNFLYRREELAHVLEQSGCRVLITMDAFGDLDYPAMLAGLDLPALEHVILLSEIDGLAAEPVDEPDVSPQDTSDILYTSGTTGAPKGVMVSHDSTQRSAFGSALTRAFGDGRRILFSLPCYHMFGYIEGLLGAMTVGGAIVPRLTFDPGDYLAAVERHRADDILCVPTMTIALLEHPERASFDLSSASALLSGAAPGPTWLWEKVETDLGITEITTGYGMTETGGAMTLTLPEDPPARHAETVGRPLLGGPAAVEEPIDSKGIHAHLIPSDAICVYATADPLSGERLDPGEEGELISTGPTHMQGFWDKPAETAEALRDGWVFSGDLGYVDDDGYLHLTGRSKELYKSGGELVMPKEVEAVLAAHDGVSQAYAVGVPDERWGEVGCAWVVPEPGSTPDAAELLTLCRERLARFKVPRHVLFTTADDLPTTPTGKVQKFNLVKRAVEELDAQHA